MIEGRSPVRRPAAGRAGALGVTPSAATGPAGEVELADGRRMTGLDLQWAYHERSVEHCAQEPGEEVDPVTAEVAAGLGRGAGRAVPGPDGVCRPAGLAGQAAAAEGYRPATGWPGPRPAAAVDLQYADVRLARACTTGWWRALDAPAGQRGRGHRRRLPPAPGRHQGLLPAAAWSVPGRGGRRVLGLVHLRPGRESLVRIPTLEPAAWHAQPRRQADRLSATAEELVAALTRG